MDNPVWIEVCADTAHQYADTLTAHLSAMGHDALSILDEKEFQENLEARRDSWDYVDQKLADEIKNVCRISFYLPENQAEKLPEIRRRLEGIREDGKQIVTGITTRRLRENDWAESWKQYYKPTPIGRRLLIQPEWEPLAPTDRVVFWNDPGLSFGTGEHETTRLCLAALEKLVWEGCSLLDVGCGSGILSIAARLLGASHSTACDIDPIAVDVARRNALRNGIDDEYRLFSGNLLNDKTLLGEIGGRRYDVITANIAADVIVALTSLIPGLLAENGVFVASGIIEPRKGEIIDAITKNGMEICGQTDENGWSLVICRIKK